MTKIHLFLFLTVLLLTGCWFNRTPEYQDYSARFEGERTKLYYRNEEWDISRFIKQELDKNPQMECSDLVKFCCQAACGIDHANENARELFYRDFNAAQITGTELIRVTSPDTARVDLGAWKAAGLPPEWLFRMSIAESSFTDCRQKFEQYLAAAALLIPGSKVKFSVGDFLKAAAVISKEPHKTHLPHSRNYPQQESTYRVISSRYFHTIPVLKKAAAISGQKSSGKKIIAIDGRSASGKTTMASQLKLILNAQTIHMDDFFLPVKLRTKLRYEQAGGNVHFERFKEEILPHIRQNAAFSYHIFDCKKLDFNGSRMIWPGEWLVVEGAYSMHPEFGDYADIKIFYDIDPAEQMRRIYERNRLRAAESFRTRWIPLEENYIRTFGIDRKADLVVK